MTPFANVTQPTLLPNNETRFEVLFLQTSWMFLGSCVRGLRVWSSLISIAHRLRSKYQGCSNFALNKGIIYSLNLWDWLFVETVQHSVYDFNINSPLVFLQKLSQDSLTSTEEHTAECFFNFQFGTGKLKVNYAQPHSARLNSQRS